jgi:hypothetical protein
MKKCPCLLCAHNCYCLLLLLLLLLLPPLWAWRLLH